MMKKIILSGLLASGLLFTGCNRADKEPKTEEDKTFFTVGNMFGQRLARLNLTDAELDMLASGLRSGAKGAKPSFEVAKYQPKVRELFQARMKKHNAKVQGEGKKYLESFVAKEGAKKTTSGLAYKVIKPGTGKAPKATDTVEVHYHGTLIDGTVFDSSR
jgi:FKBP-type peptidyl-prolyl cis-trans isomerase